MNDLLRRYVVSVLLEMQRTAHVPNQLVGSPKGGKKKDKEEKKDEAMAIGTGGIAGFTGPLGASAADMGKKPTKPGGRLKKSKRNKPGWS